MRTTYMIYAEATVTFALRLLKRCAFFFAAISHHNKWMRVCTLSVKTLISP